MTMFQDAGRSPQYRDRAGWSMPSLPRALPMVMDPSRSAQYSRGGRSMFSGSPEVQPAPPPEPDMSGPEVQAEMPDMQMAEAPAARQVARADETGADSSMFTLPTEKPPVPATAQQPVEGAPASSPVKQEDARVTSDAAKTYLKTLNDQLADVPDESPAQKKNRLRDALFVGGLAMMQAGSRRGANLGGSLAEGALQGFGVYKSEEDKRKAEDRQKRGDKLAAAKGAYDVDANERKLGFDDRKIGFDEDRARVADRRAGIEDKRTEAQIARDAARDAETSRHNRAQEGIESERTAKGTKSAQRDLGTYYEETYRRVHPEATDQEVANYVLDSMTNRKSMTPEEIRIKARAELGKDPNFMFAEPEEQDRMMDKFVTDISRVSPAARGGENQGKTATPAPGAGPVAGATRVYQGKTYKFKGGDPKKQANWIAQ